MRIDEVIDERAPVGIFKRAGNFLQSKIGTAGSKAKGQGKRQVAAIANKINVDIQKLMGQQGMDEANMLTDAFFEVFKKYAMSKKYTSAQIKHAEDEFKEAQKKHSPDGVDKMASIIAGGGKKGIFDKIILSFAQNAMATGLPTAAADVDGDGKPDVGSDGSPDAQPGAQPGGNMGDAEKVNNNAASAVQNALDKLDPDLQAYAFRYLQNKARS